MNASDARTQEAYELRFQHLFVAEWCWAFPCDARGRVDMDALGERALNSYLYARAMRGRETAAPVVCRH